MRLTVPVCVIAFIMLNSFAVNVIVAAPATLEDAQSSYASGDYRKALKQIAALLATSQAKIGSQARYDALCLRGESLLQLKEANLAADAFDSASRAITRDSDLKDTSGARGMALLIRKSPGLKYKPRDGEPIDIVDPAKRKEALAALYKDDLAAMQGEYDRAMKGTSLKPMIELLPELTNLYAIESAATGATEKTDPMAKAMGQRARELIDVEMARMSTRIGQLEDIANEPSSTDVGGGRTEYSRLGLTSIQQDEAKEMAQYLDKIRQTAQEGRRINRRIGGTGEVWDPVIAEATELRDRAAAAYERK